jgi:hypothetical protein
MFNLKKGLLQFLPTLKDGFSLQGLYENNNGIDEQSLYEFFNGYHDYMWELANENIENPTFDSVFNQFDNKDVLYEWFYCYDNFDWVVYVDDNDDDDEND